MTFRLRRTAMSDRLSTPLPPTLNTSRFTFNGLFRLIRQSIQDRLKLQACILQRLFIRISRNPDVDAPQIEASTPWVWDHEPIPAREEFFVEERKVGGTIGTPVVFSSANTP